MRYSLLLVPVAALGLLASCGDNPTSSDASATTIATPATGPSDTEPVDTGPTTTVAGALPKPEVKIPATLPTELVVTDITEGTGPAAVVGDTVVVHYVGVRSADGTEFDNSYDRGAPFPVTLGVGQVIKGWDQGLVGIKAGGRRQLDIPADLAYGDTPQGDVIQAGDALSFVVDVVAIVPKSDPADAPVISIPPTPNQTEQTFTDLIVGDGPGIEPGQTVTVAAAGVQRRRRQATRLVVGVRRAAHVHAGRQAIATRSGEGRRRHEGRRSPPGQHPVRRRVR